MELHESAVTCLQREIREELGVEIRILMALPASEWSHPDFNPSISGHLTPDDIAAGMVFSKK